MPSFASLSDIVVEASPPLPAPAPARSPVHCFKQHPGGRWERIPLAHAQELLDWINRDPRQFEGFSVLIRPVTN